jgi:broad specificity phosphatase PhoE
MIHITYFVHGTTTDNEQGKASGHYDVELSELGIRQSNELKELIKGRKFDIVFCSDLKRAVDSAKLTFGNSAKIIQDKRLRECDYGALTRQDKNKVDELMLGAIEKPFPNGESYKQVEKRIRGFIKDLKNKYEGKHIAIVAHQAPQLALDVILKGKTWNQAIREDWRRKKPKQWKPGWEYNV